MNRGISIPGVVCCLLFSVGAVGHSNLSGIVQHTVELSMDAEYIDLGVQLRFNGPQAQTMYESLDKNGDGQLSHPEKKGYTKTLNRMLHTHLSLKVGHSTLDLVQRYEPRFQYSGDGLSATLDISLFCFSRLPKRLWAASRIEIEDRLFPNLPGIASFSASGKDGINLHADCTRDDLSRPADPKEALVLRAHILHERTVPSEGDTDEN